MQRHRAAAVDVVYLLDTSVWIDHFRSPSPTLADIDVSDLLTHPFVIGELACGMFRRRREVLERLTDLPAATVASNEEVLQFIEEHRLMGRGIGYIDAHLLASVALTRNAQLWTHDKHLAAVAAELRLGLSRN
jgi:predicted nucleic acid-binding protein